MLQILALEQCKRHQERKERRALGKEHRKMVKEEFVFPDEEEVVTLTRPEIDALNIYADKVRRETITAIFDEVEELLQMALRTEKIKAKQGDSYTHRYAKRLC